MKDAGSEGEKIPKIARVLNQDDISVGSENSRYFTKEGDALAVAAQLVCRKNHERSLG